MDHCLRKLLKKLRHLVRTKPTLSTTPERVPEVPLLLGSFEWHSKASRLSKQLQQMLSPFAFNESGPREHPVTNESAPHHILKVERDCSPEELTQAWRDLVKKWHPDKLEDMAPELRLYAEERLKAINLAYAQLKKQCTEE